MIIGLKIAHLNECLPSHIALKVFQISLNSLLIHECLFVNSNPLFAISITDLSFQKRAKLKCFTYFFTTSKELTAVGSKDLREQIIIGSNNGVYLFLWRSNTCAWELELEGGNCVRTAWVHLQ